MKSSVELSVSDKKIVSFSSQRTLPTFQKNPIIKKFTSTNIFVRN